MKLNRNNIYPIIKKVINTAAVNEWLRSNPDSVDYNELHSEVTLEDYYIGTETTFVGSLRKEADERNTWEEMKASGKYSWHQSPLSSSEYLIDETTGDIFRFSNHWGRVASCTWGLLLDGHDIIGGSFAIGKSNLKNFKRRTDARYFVENENRDWKAFEAILRKVVRDLRKLMRDNEVSEAMLKKVEMAIDITKSAAKEHTLPHYWAVYNGMRY